MTRLVTAAETNMRLVKDYEALWKFLENLDRKQGIHNMKQELIWKLIYDFATTAATIDVGELKGRVEYLTEQNIKWYTQASNLETQCAVLNQRVQELEKLLNEQSEVTKLSSNES